MHFQTEEELQKHSQSHKGDRYHKCNFDNKCSYSAKTLDKLNAHIRYHSGERPFKCDFIGCHQDFIQSHHLARHRKTHFGNEQTSSPLPLPPNEDVISESEDMFQCQYCDLSFEEELTFEQHMADQHSLQISDNMEMEVKSKTALKRNRTSDSLSKSDDLPEIDLESEDGPQEKVCISGVYQKKCKNGLKMFGSNNNRRPLETHELIQKIVVNRLSCQKQ